MLNGNQLTPNLDKMLRDNLNNKKKKGGSLEEYYYKLGVEYLKGKRKIKGKWYANVGLTINFIQIDNDLTDKEKEDLLRKFKKQSNIFLHRKGYTVAAIKEEKEEAVPKELLEKFEKRLEKYELTDLTLLELIAVSCENNKLIAMRRKFYLIVFDRELAALFPSVFKKRYNLSRQFYDMSVYLDKEIKNHESNLLTIPGILRDTYTIKNSSSKRATIIPNHNNEIANKEGLQINITQIIRFYLSNPHMSYKEKESNLVNVKWRLLTAIQKTKALSEVFDKINKKFFAFRNARQRMLSIFNGISEEDQMKLLGIGGFIRLLPTVHDISTLEGRLECSQRNLNNIEPLGAALQACVCSLVVITECCKKEEKAKRASETKSNPPQPVVPPPKSSTELLCDFGHFRNTQSTPSKTAEGHKLAAEILEKERLRAEIRANRTKAEKNGQHDEPPASTRGTINKPTEHTETEQFILRNTKSGKETRIEAFKLKNAVNLHVTCYGSERLKEYECFKDFQRIIKRAAETGAISPDSEGLNGIKVYSLDLGFVKNIAVEDRLWCVGISIENEHENENENLLLPIDIVPHPPYLFLLKHRSKAADIAEFIRNSLRVSRVQKEPADKSEASLTFAGSTQPTSTHTSTWAPSCRP